jgi:hypothetical protein
MMSIFYQSLIIAHVSIGFVSLVLFWIPVMAKKGSKLHISAGRWYARAMYTVGFSALTLALMMMLDPIATKYGAQSLNADEIVKLIDREWHNGLFLMAISILVLVGVRHGLLTLRAKKDHDMMKSTSNLSLNMLLLAVGLYLGYVASGNSPLNTLFYIFAALCSFTAIGNLRYCLKSSVTRGERIVAHLNGMIGAGIGAHTAFFVFGASQLLTDLLTGYWALVPWILPGLVGSVLIAVQSQKYKPQPRSTNGSTTPSQA